MILELQEKVNNFFYNYSLFESENVKKDENSTMERLTPHSNHFLTLFLVDVMEIDNTERMKIFGDEEQCTYILDFVSPKKQNSVLHLKAKMCNMRGSRSDLLIVSFLPNEAQ